MPVSLVTLFVLISGNAILQSAADFFNSGTSKIGQRNYHEAIADFKQAIALSPHFEPAWLSLAASKTQIGDDHSAILDLNQLIKLNGASYDAYCMRGIIKSILKDCAAAMRDFNTSIRINSKYAEAFYYRSNEFYFLNDTINPQSDSKKAVTLGFKEN